MSETANIDAVNRLLSKFSVGYIDKEEHLFDKQPVPMLHRRLAVERQGIF